MKVNMLQARQLKLRGEEHLDQIGRYIMNSLYRDLETAPPPELLDALDRWEKTLAFVIRLKRKIAETSRPVMLDILSITEQDQALRFYADLKHGQRNREGLGLMVKENTTEKSELLKIIDQKHWELACELDEVYARINKFNASTEIEIEEFPFEENEPFL